jgi:uncharacterized YokU family protein
MQCEWCGENEAELINNTVYWELPDGSRAKEIQDTPAVKCNACGIEYQEETVINELEDQLMLNLKLTIARHLNR